MDSKVICRQGSYQTIPYQRLYDVERVFLGLGTLKVGPNEILESKAICNGSLTRRLASSSG
jgi:hypothetical protein